MQTFYKICLILMIIGGINWGLVGLFQFDFVGWLLGGGSLHLVPDRVHCGGRGRALRHPGSVFRRSRVTLKRLLAKNGPLQGSRFSCAILFFFPADKIGQGKGLIRAVGIGGTMGRHRRPLDLPHDVVDGPAVFGQVGLVAAGVGEQNLAQVAHHQCQG